MRIKAKKIFITGGAGFIGTALIDRLIKNNEIVIYDNFHRNSIKNSPWRTHANLKVIEGDVLDLTGLKRNIKDSHYVIHLAAIAGIDTVIQDQVKTMKVNLIGTFNVLKAASALKECRRFVDFSTSEVFGPHAGNCSEKNDTVIGAIDQPRWRYAASKLAAEHLVHSYRKELNLPALSVRPFNIYGPGQVGEGAIQNFVLRAIKNDEIQIHGTGGQIRSWCYIDDLVDAVLKCIEVDRAVGEVFNIGNPAATVTINELARIVVRILNSKSRICLVPRNGADVKLRIPSIEKAETILGFEPKVGLEEGIRRTADWYRKTPGVMSPLEIK